MQNPLLQFFNDELILSNICQYLTISEKLRLAATSKSIRYNMNQLIKVLLKQNDLSLIPGKTPLRQLRFYFDRCLTVFNFDEQGKWVKLFTQQNPFKYEVISKFQVGNNYSAFLNNKSKAYVFKTNVLKNGLMKGKNGYQTLNEVKSIHCKAEKLYYLKQDGSVWTCFSDKLQTKCLQNNVMINWTDKVPIQKMTVSYNYIILFPKKADRQKILLQVILKQQDEQQNELPKKIQKQEIQQEFQGNIYKQDKFQGQSQGNYLIALNILTNKLYIIKTPPQQIESCVAGNKQAYFLTKSHRCFWIEFQEHIPNNQYCLRPFSPFKGKSIVKIASGHNFFLALQRNMQKIEDWSTQRVAKWMREIGFQSFVRIATVQKLDGKKLKNIQRKYMQNVLGINKANMIQKFLMCIDQLVNTKVYDQDTLYGWGKNEYGQLASSSANYINQPIKIKLPSMKENQYIDSIFCGWEQTFVRTQKGRIHFTKRNVQKKKERQYEITMQVDKKPVHKKSKQIQNLQQKQQDSDADADDFQDAKFKYIKKKKRTQDFKDKDKKQVKGAKKFQEQEKWCESQFGKAFFVQGYKQFVFCIQCPQQNIQEPQRRVKLRTAKAILDKILWGRTNKQDFKIGYLDKQMGIIEYTTSEIQNFEVKQNRIKYFKQKGLIVWDRQNKIDHF